MSKEIRVVFFGSTKNACLPLTKLSETFNISLVVSQPDEPVGRKQVMTPTPLAQTARELGLPVSKPEKLKNNPTFLEELADLQADLFIVSSYGKIIPQELLNIPPRGCINFHPSLLPLYRGATPIQSCLRDGCTTTGSTIILMDSEMDHGPVLAQEPLSVDPDDTYDSLETKLAIQMTDLAVRMLPKYLDRKVNPENQDHTKATFTALLKKSDGLLNWADSAQSIYNMYRAYSRWPKIHTFLGGKRIVIVSCALATDTDDTHRAAPVVPGLILKDGSVVCGDGKRILVQSFVVEGKPIQNKLSFFTGQVFDSKPGL